MGRPVHPLALTFVALSTLAAVGRGEAEAEVPPASFTIYCAEESPASVRLAASELQRVVRLSTGTELPIRHEPRPPMIALGDTAAARQAGVEADTLPDDGFRIVSRGPDVFIVGKDRAGRGGRGPFDAWGSRGTLFGTFDFLERVLGVRWLLPGEWGEDIPERRTLEVPPLSITDAPDFAIRRLSDIQEWGDPGDVRSDHVRKWALRQRLPSLVDGRRVQHGHAWDDYGMPEVLRAHPEYRAVAGDKTKFCTSNAEAVRAFADGVIRWLDTHSEQRSASISPTDGGAFCRCERCRALVGRDPHGRPSYAKLILRFYTDVARLVAAKHPDRLLGGYVYSSYMYPPDDPEPVPANVVLVWAPLNYYGWGLQKPVYRKEFPGVLAGWTSITPNLVYHDYSTWMRALNGSPLPPGFDILRLELPTLHRAGVRGAEMVGIGAWGYGGPSNYILARQLWDADVDIEALWREWLTRAYGPGWPAMDELYRLVEARMKARKERESPVYRSEMYEVNQSLVEDVYAPVFPELERLYLHALEGATTAPQQKRLEMFGENLVILHRSLCLAGLVDEPRASSFFRTDDEYARFLEDTEDSLALYRGRGERYTGPLWRGQWRGE